MGKFNFGGTPLTAVEKLRGEERLAEITKAPERITPEETSGEEVSPLSLLPNTSALFSGIDSSPTESEVITRSEEVGQDLQQDLESGEVSSADALKAVFTDAVESNPERLETAQFDRAQAEQPTPLLDQEGNVRPPQETWSLDSVEAERKSEEEAGVVNGGYPVDGNWRVRSMALSEKVRAGEYGFAGLSKNAADNVTLNTLNSIDAYDPEAGKPRGDFLEILALVTEDSIAQLAYGTPEDIQMNPGEGKIGEPEDLYYQSVDLAAEELKGLNPFTKDKGNKDLGMRISREFQKYNNAQKGLPTDEYTDITPEEATALGDQAKELYYSVNKTYEGKQFMLRDTVVDNNGNKRSYFSLTSHGVNMIRQGEAQRKLVFPSKVIRPNKRPGGKDKFEKRKLTRNISSKSGPAIKVEKTFQAIRNLSKVQHVVDPRRNKILLVTALPILLDDSIAAAGTLESAMNHVGQDKVNRFRRKAQEDAQANPRINGDQVNEYVERTVQSSYTQLIKSLAQDIKGIALERNSANSLSFYIQNFNGRIAPKESTLDLTSSKSVRFVTRSVVPGIIDVRTPRGRFLEESLKLMYGNMLLGKAGGPARDAERLSLLETKTPQLYAWGKELRSAFDKIPDSKIEEINIAIDNNIPVRSPNFPTVPRLDIKNPDLLNAIKSEGSGAQVYMDGLIDFANYMDFKNKTSDRRASPNDSDYQFSTYFNNYDDGKTNGAATIGMQLGSKPLAYKTGILRTQAKLQLDNNKDLRDELQDVLLESLDRNGIGGTFASETSGLMHDVATQLFAIRDLNKATTMTFGYGKELESFKKDIREFLELMDIEARESGANYNPVAQTLEAIDTSSSDRESMDVLVDIMHDTYVPGLVQVLDDTALEYRTAMRGAAVLHALSNEMFTIESPSGSSISMGGVATIGSIDSKPYKIFDKDLPNKKKPGEFGAYRSANVEIYGSELTSAASKPRTSSTGEITYTPGERAYGGSVPAPVQAMDAGSIVVTFTGKSWDRIMTDSRGQPYVHPIYDAVKTDVMSYRAVYDEINQNYYDLNMKWSALEEVNKSLVTLRKNLSKRYAGRSDSDLASTNEWSMYGRLLEPSYGEQGAYLGELARVLSKTMNLPVYNKVPIDLNVKVVESKGKTVGDRYVPAFYDGKGKITIDKNYVMGPMFESKAWTKPKVEGVTPLPENEFQTPEDWYTFVLGHEVMHTRVKQKDNESKADYENRINTLTLNAIKAGLLNSSGQLFKLEIIKEHPQVQAAVDRIEKAMKDAGYNYQYPSQQPTVKHMKAFMTAYSKEIDLQNNLNKLISKTNNGKKEIDQEQKKQKAKGLGGTDQYRGN